MRSLDKMAIAESTTRAVMLPGQPMPVQSHSVRPSGDFPKLLGIIALSTMGAVLAYAVFEWGGVLRSDQYPWPLSFPRIHPH